MQYQIIKFLRYDTKAKFNVDSNAEWPA